MRKRIVGIIPARLDSSRLPGKGLLEIKGKAILYYLLRRLQCVVGIDDVIIATTDRYCDNPLVAWAEANEIGYYRGGLEDVLGRFYSVAEKYNADIVIKANGDCPLLSHEVINAGIKQIISEDLDFLTGKNKYTGLPVGLGAEIISFAALKRLNSLADTQYHRDNITTYIFDNPGEFRWRPIDVLPAWKEHDMSLMLDTIEDFEIIKAIINEFDHEDPGSWKIEKIIEARKKI